MPVFAWNLWNVSCGIVTWIGTGIVVKSHGIWTLQVPIIRAKVGPFGLIETSSKQALPRKKSCIAIDNL